MTKQESIELRLTKAQIQTLRVELGISSDRLKIDPETMQGELLNVKRIGALRLSTEQKKELQSSSKVLEGFEVCPQTFRIRLIDTDEARDLGAMWGEASPPD